MKLHLAGVHPRDVEQALFGAPHVALEHHHDPLDLLDQRPASPARRAAPQGARVSAAAALCIGLRRLVARRCSGTRREHRTACRNSAMISSRASGSSIIPPRGRAPDGVRLWEVDKSKGAVSLLFPSVCRAHGERSIAPPGRSPSFSSSDPSPRAAKIRQTGRVADSRRRDGLAGQHRERVHMVFQRLRRADRSRRWGESRGARLLLVLLRSGSPTPTAPRGGTLTPILANDLEVTQDVTPRRGGRRRPTRSACLGT